MSKPRPQHVMSTWLLACSSICKKVCVLRVRGRWTSSLRFWSCKATWKSGKWQDINLCWVWKNWRIKLYWLSKCKLWASFSDCYWKLNANLNYHSSLIPEKIKHGMSYFFCRLGSIISICIHVYICKHKIVSLLAPNCSCEVTLL